MNGIEPSLAAEVFREDGLLSRNHDGYEPRPGQLTMSEAVGAAIRHGHHLLMEAPTGIGKTFAYLVPAIESGRKVVVSTGTKNLQEQLFFKDIPALSRVLGRPITAAYMKGRENYLCIKRAREFGEQPLFEDMDEVDSHSQVARWSRETSTGDRGELADLPERLQFWDRINARADTCLGQKCPDFEPCFLTLMRRRAAEAQIVVVNHHLLLADLLLKDHAFGQVIPDYSVLILDEAHVLEDVATIHLGSSVSRGAIDRLAADLEAGISDPELRRLAGSLRDSAKGFFGIMRDRTGRFPLEEYRHDDLWKRAGADLREALSLCESAIRRSDGVLGDGPDTAALGRRVEQLQGTLDRILRAVPVDGSGPTVTWGELRGRGISLHVSMVDVSDALRQMLFSRVPTVVLTSATLAVAGSFDFVHRRLGIDEAVDLALESPFDPARQTVLYVPRDLPEPSSRDFVPGMAARLRDLLAITEGRAFVLFTSYVNLRKVRESLAGDLPYPILVQGESSRHALLETFRSTAGAVLLATSSFWHGVDVQGDALSLVVIDKLPFDVPSDPIVAARIDAIREAGGAPFPDYQIPTAVIDLKQGLGRLIRSSRDRGILAVMDSRLMTRSYGRVFLGSLPPYPITHDIEAVRDFFAGR